MSFNTSLSGLQAATHDLDVTGNNIANVSTTGFKGSRVEFGDIYAVSAFGTTSNTIGSGVKLQNVSQQFTQGNLQFTENSLDLAISGQGFFVMNESLTNAEPVYTRAGAFSVDRLGFIVNNAGQPLQVFPVDANGNASSTGLSSATSIQVPSATGAPVATTELEIGLNLDSSATIVVGATNTAGPDNPFDPSVSASFTSSTSATIFDSLGNSHISTYFFQKRAANTWNVFHYLDGAPTDITGGTSRTHTTNGAGAAAQLAGTLVFSSSGAIDTGASTSAGLMVTSLTITTGATSPQPINLDFANNGTTQFASAFSINTLTQDGFTTGRLSSLDIAETGTIRANYTNGQVSLLGKIAVADFPNAQGLNPSGNTAWKETVGSGSVVTGEAGTGRFGLIQSGAIEASNVNLTEQLVRLITAQRNFQANARAIETSNTITQTVINIR